MSTTLTPRRQKRNDTDERILKAAMHQFGENGFTTASLTDIAAEAGVSQGLVSQRFESKEKLLEAAFRATPAMSFFLSEVAEMATVSTSLNAALLSIVAALKKEQRTDRRRFAFTAMLYTSRDVPESFTAFSHSLYQGTVLPSLFEKARSEPGDGSVVHKISSERLFTVFYRNALATIRDCAETGLPMPEDAFFLTVLGLAVPGDGSLVTNASREPGDGSPVQDAPATAATKQATADFVEQVRPAFRAVEGYIGLIRKHADNHIRVRDYASKAELIASELVKKLDKMK